MQVINSIYRAGPEMFAIPVDVKLDRSRRDHAGHAWTEASEKGSPASNQLNQPLQTVQPRGSNHRTMQVINSIYRAEGWRAFCVDEGGIFRMS
jgi:hypothetical protein